MNEEQSEDFSENEDETGSLTESPENKIVGSQVQDKEDDIQKKKKRVFSIEMNSNS